MSLKIAEAKSQLRSVILAKRRAMPARRRAAAATAIAATLRAELRARQPRTVAAYAPFGTEPGNLALLDLVQRAGATVLLPLTDATEPRWARYDADVGLRTVGRLWEPAGPALEKEAPNSADLIIVPSLAVDETGARLGRGGGFYDRALAGLAVPTVALLYDSELLPSVPSEPHDVQVASVITPTLGWRELSLALDNPQC